MRRASVLGRLAGIIGLTVFATIIVGGWVTQDTNGQTRSAHHDKAIERMDRRQQLRALEAIAAELETQRMLAEANAANARRKSKPKSPSVPQVVTSGRILPIGRWATDLEIRGRYYFVLWSDGSVSAGGTLP